MLFQSLIPSIIGLEWIIGVGLMFGLAFIFMFLTKKTISSFFVWLVIFNGFMVWGGLLELWTLVLTLIILVAVIYLEVKGSSLIGD